MVAELATNMNNNGAASGVARHVRVLVLMTLVTCACAVMAQEGPRNKDGKKLFGSAEALKLVRVTAPRISRDGTRVGYLVAENQMDKDTWKTVTHLWVVPTAGPASAA